MTRPTWFTSTIVTSTRFTRVATGAFGTAFYGFGTTTARMTRRHSTDVGERIFQTFLARFSSGQILKITRVAIQTIDRTFIIRVLANCAIQTRVVARYALMLSFATIFAFG